MPKVYGVKEKDQVVAHVVNLILTGKLRSGDRIDRNEIAEDLGLSRVPVQEAVVQLEHDGILATRYHRGAFIERFDESTLAEHYEMHGLLNGMASARAAADRSPTILATLEGLLRQLRVLTESRTFFDVESEYRTVINDQYAGPRLRALIRSSLSFTPRTFWVAYSESHAELLEFYESETDAIRRGDADAARTANNERTAVMARIMIAELRRRRVLGDLGSP
jgi:DNA-binding GntR family transcriptional regulator